MTVTANDILQRPMRALVTGAASGLGKAISLQLLEDGFEVLAADLPGPALDALLENSTGVDGSTSIETLGLDHCDLDGLERFVEHETLGRFDLVVLNAGISATGKFEEIPGNAHLNVMTVNAIAPMELAAGLARNNRFHDKSELVFVSSLSHAVGYPGAASYAASKDAIAVYAKSIRSAFAKRGINVLCVFPGPIRTGHAERHAPLGAKAEKRMAPDDLAKRILLASAKGKKVLYPGFAAKVSRIGGKLFPSIMTKLMCRIIYDKLDRSVY